MNKEEIISILNRYNFNKNKFCIISGAALVLLNIIEKTKDIDIMGYRRILLSIIKRI